MRNDWLTTQCGRWTRKHAGFVWVIHSKAGNLFFHARVAERMGDSPSDAAGWRAAAAWAQRLAEGTAGARTCLIGALRAGCTREEPAGVVHACVGRACDFDFHCDCVRLRAIALVSAYARFQAPVR